MKQRIQPFTIVGDKQFAEAFGICDKRTIASMRKAGMPALHNGKAFVYVVSRVIDWMETNWKIQQVKQY